MLRARADMVSVPVAVLLQRAQLAGATVGAEPHPLHAAGQCFHQDRGLGSAQKLADRWDPAELHRRLEEFARHYCPILKHIEQTYHWSLDEAEYATDIVFHRQADLQAIYGHLIRTAIHTVKPDNVATFLGKKLNGNCQDEMGNRYKVRIEARGSATRWAWPRSKCTTNLARSFASRPPRRTFPFSNTTER